MKGYFDLASKDKTQTFQNVEKIGLARQKCMQNNSLKLNVTEKIFLLTSKLALTMLRAFPPNPQFPQSDRDSTQSQGSSLYRSSEMPIVFSGRYQKDYVAEGKVELQPRSEVTPSRGGRQVEKKTTTRQTAWKPARAEKNTDTSNKNPTFLRIEKYSNTPHKPTRSYRVVTAPGVKDTEVCK